MNRADLSIYGPARRRSQPESGVRVHPFGAQGLGCSSLAHHLARALGSEHIDTDDYNWHKIKPPFLVRAEQEQRNARLLQALSVRDRWVLAGSVSGWELQVDQLFTVAVLVRVPTAVRMARLRAQEIARYGRRAERGGDLYAASQAFLAWTKFYDEGSPPGRSVAQQHAWLASLACPTLVFFNDANLETSAERLRLQREAACTEARANQNGQGSR